MRILVLGASGMAGHVISIYLAEQGHDVTPLAGHKKVTENTVLLDLTDKNAFEEYLANNTFDVIVNCVGILIELSDTRKDLASYLNGYLPHYLEQRFKDSDTKLVHLSTDCVYSGLNGPYREDSPYDGQTFYDRSKALGEIINNKDLTFRMSIIGPDLSPEGVGLFNWFMKQSGTIGGWKNAIWNGVTTIELAHAIEAAIDEKLTGLYHLTPETETINKYDLLLLCKDVFGRDDITVEPKDNKATNKTLLNTRSDFSFKVHSYVEMVNQMKEWIDSHSELYPHYK